MIKIYIVFALTLVNNICINGGFIMKNKKLFWIIGIISVVAALSAALTAFFIVKEKQKKDDEELMEYLDSSIE